MRYPLLAGIVAWACLAPPDTAPPPTRAPAPNPAGLAQQDGAAVQAGADTLRLDGEYGLRVARAGDSVRVAWVTFDSAAGSLQVLEGDRVRFQTTTPAGRAHAAAFTHRGGGSLLLRYGAVGNDADRHDTAIRLDPPRRPAVEYQDVDSIFVMGDIHGEFDTLVATLRNAGVIDARGRWAAGGAHLVVVGDMIDRGRDVNRVLWFLYGLEPQAEQAGGRLHVLLGNHEIMVMLDDLRYVHPKELSLARLHGVTYDRLFDPRTTILGTWLASKPALVRIDDALLAHGGVSTDYLDYTTRSYDDTLEAYVSEDLFYHWKDTTFVAPLDSAGMKRRNDFFWGENSVFWYRGYAMADTLGSELDRVLDRFDAEVHVVGHTPDRTMRERYGGRLIAVNTVPFAAELLLLEKTGEGYRRWRFRSTGAAEAL